MTVVIITDIFGLCDSTDNLSSFLSHYVNDVVIVEPYQGVRHNFKNEQEAYRAFVNKCGHENYFVHALDYVLRLKPELIIGFSAGASAAWKISGIQNTGCKKLFCFYPTQIRNHLDVIPQNKVEVIFPKTENTFNVSELHDILECYLNVESQITVYEHGFMNESSGAYNIHAEKFGLERIEKYLINK
ncbi:dienelactone hydrolase family protein [Photobacterium minamisatsumaniensis]|uniref:dienelactone hydrolase family protein n=1 Tax=Photobacterium minamisatsumaniensis TaxID=2910233 RepID=UPI003D119FCB